MPCHVILRGRNGPDSLHVPDTITAIDLFNEVALRIGGSTQTATELQPHLRVRILGREVGPTVDLLDFSEETVAVADIRVRGCGGKGGFGAQLRSGQGGVDIKKTTDFGSCRDLNGRRLRTVENEKKVQEWTQENERRERERLEMRQKTEKEKQERKKQELEQRDREREQAVKESIDAVSEAVKDGVLAVLAEKKQAPKPAICSKRKAAWEDEMDFGVDEVEEDEDEHHGEKNDSSSKRSRTDSNVDASAQETVTNNKSTKKEEKKEEESDDELEFMPENVVLEKIESKDALQKYTLNQLRDILNCRGLKCGGTLDQRIDRLWAVRGKSTDEIDPSLLAGAGGKRRKRKRSPQ